MAKEINHNGCEIVRKYGFGGDRYRFDFDLCSSKLGWLQYDTCEDASYFGVWVHPNDFKIVHFIEGDVIITLCPCKDAFNKELEELEKCYGSPPPTFIVYDQDGSRTEVYCPRPKAE